MASVLLTLHSHLSQSGISSKRREKHVLQMAARLRLKSRAVTQADTMSICRQGSISMKLEKSGTNL